MQIGKIIGLGASAATLGTGAFVNKMYSSYRDGYCVDDVYNNDPSVSGGSYRRVPPQDDTDYQHDVFIPLHDPNYDTFRPYYDEFAEYCP